MISIYCPLCHAVATYFGQRDNYTYYRCASCITLFLHPMPSAHTLNAYYHTSFIYHAAEGQENGIRLRSRHILNHLTHLRSSGTTLCDIGSGYGYFLQEANQYGLKSTGIEPSHMLYTYARNVLHTNTLNFSLDGYISQKHDVFDFVTMIHVIEHVADPRLAIIQAASLLKPGGILYIETPNLDSILFQTERLEYTFLTPPDHVWIFSRGSMARIITPETTLILKTHSTYSSPSHFSGIIRRLLHQTTRVTSSSRPTGSSQRNERSLGKDFKHIVLDTILSPLCYRVLNRHGKGSILELYYEKNA